MKLRWFMRRLQQSETLHGTKTGQVPVDNHLAHAYHLSERESACAALLLCGLTQKEIADRLDISVSTVEKHLRALREKLGVKNSKQAINAIKNFNPNGDASIPEWPAPPALMRTSSDTHKDDAFIQHLRTCHDLETSVRALRNHLTPRGVRHILYLFLPMNALSFLSNEMILEMDATPEIVSALETLGAVNVTTVAIDIYQNPDRHVVSDLTHDITLDENTARVPFLRACLETGCEQALSLGAPFGGGFVAATALLDSQITASSDFSMDDLAGHFRGALMTMHNAAFAFGALAATADLSTRERDALSLLAAGHSTSVAAETMKISTRAFTNFIKTAKAKLRAKTTNEAIYKAAALNALVFL